VTLAPDVLAPRVVHRYQPRGAAREILECRDPEVLLSGPAGTGKSRAALQKMHLVALKYPGMRGLIVRKTLASLGSTSLVTWREHVVPEALRAGILAFHGGSREEAAAYRYANGSRVVVGGMDKPTKIMSSEYDMVFVEEAIELTDTDWESITTRLRNGRMPYQQLIASTNPAQPTHWLKLRCDAGSCTMLHSKHEDNPVLFNDDGTMTERGTAYLATLDRLTGVRYQRLRKGLWVAAEGLVFEDWDPAVHVIPWFNPPKDWPRWWVVDFGFRHAMVVSFWAQDPDGRLYNYREFYRRGVLVEDMARRILDEVCPEDPATGERKWLEPRPVAVITDHDAEDRATLERHLEFSTVAAHKSVSDGIQAVAVRLRPDGSGKPQILFMADAVLDGRQKSIVDAGQPASTIEEFAGYVWDTGGGKKITEMPLKIFDDGIDTARYMVAQMDIVGRPNIRWMPE
jgi:terminase large subunit-like protein